MLPALGRVVLIACRYPFLSLWPSTNLIRGEQHFSLLKHSSLCAELQHSSWNLEQLDKATCHLIKPHAFCVLTAVTWAASGIPLWDVSSPFPGLRAAGESQLTAP